MATQPEYGNTYSGFPKEIFAFQENHEKVNAMRIVILNDTRPDRHHGCSRVMTILEEGLRARGGVILATSPLRHAWWSDRVMLRAIARAEAIVINGEGTLHHGRPAARDLLQIVDCPQAAQKPIYLVNALYQENPHEWGGMLRRLAGVWPRDSHSAAELSQAIGHPVPWMLDLTLCAKSPEDPRERQGLVIGDSVDQATSDILARVAAARGATLIPSLQRLKSVQGRTGLRLFLRHISVRRHEARMRRTYSNLRIAPDPQSYAHLVGSAALHITGRFHGVCFSILTGTPFLAITSNSWKIEALLKDIGLDPDRIVTPDTLEAAIDRRDWAYSTAERAAIRASLDQARSDAGHMFDRIIAGA